MPDEYLQYTIGKIPRQLPSSEKYPEPTRVYIEPGILDPIGTPLTEKQTKLLHRQIRKLPKSEPAPSKYQLAALTRLARLRPDQQEKLRTLKQQIIEQRWAEEKARIAPMLAAEKQVSVMPIEWQVPSEVPEDRGIVAKIRDGSIYEHLESVKPFLSSLKPHIEFLRRELDRTDKLINDYQQYIMSKYNISEKAYETFLPSEADKILGNEIHQRQSNLIRVIRYGRYRPVAIGEPPYAKSISTAEEEMQLAEFPFRTRY